MEKEGEVHPSREGVPWEEYLSEKEIEKKEEDGIASTAPINKSLVKINSVVVLPHLWFQLRVPMPKERMKRGGQPIS
jgi:hypothetical protein